MRLVILDAIVLIVTSLQWPLQTTAHTTYRVDRIMHTRAGPGTWFSERTEHPLQWRHNEPDDVSNDRCLYCLTTRFFRRISTKTPKLRITGLLWGNSPVAGEFPAPMSRDEENVSIWWRHRAEQNCVITSFIQCSVRAHMHQWKRPTLIGVMACCLVNAKPLLDKMVLYCQFYPNA